MNKEAMKERAMIHRNMTRSRNRKHVDAYLSSHPCVDCGNSDIRVLEFDHVRGIKRTEVSKMVRNGFSTEKIDKEIEKCDIRCANCHRIKTRETLWSK